MYRGKYISNVKNVPTRDGSAPHRAAPASQHTAPARKTTPAKRRKIGPGGIIFYILYFLLLAAMALGTMYLLNFLGDWLMDFEASQPDTKSQQIFDSLFADPDWSEIYDLMDQDSLGVTSREDFCAYMSKKVGSQELTFSKTSAGLTGGSKYVLRLGEENIGTFSMRNAVTGDLEIPDWQLSQVEIFTSTDEFVTIHTQQGHTVKVGDVVLDDTYVIQTTQTAVEKYLPEGVHGYRTATYYVDDLMVAPVVTVTDAMGNPVSLVYDEATKTYTEPAPAVATISEAEQQFVIDATKTYFRYMMNVSGDAQLRKYFTGNSDSIKSIRKDEWLQNYYTYKFGTPTVKDYCRYSSTLYSVRMIMDLNVVRTNNTTKTFSLDTTYFVQTDGSKQGIIDMTNVDVSEVFTQVRLSCTVDGKVVSSQMVDNDTARLQLPTVEVPEGKVFTGWFRESVDANGDKTLTLVFKADDIDETGMLQLPSGYLLEPMELQALFDKKGE